MAALPKCHHQLDIRKLTQKLKYNHTHCEMISSETTIRFTETKSASHLLYGTLPYGIPVFAYLQLSRLPRSCDSLLARVLQTN